MADPRGRQTPDPVVPGRGGPARGRGISIGFMVLWLIVWGAAIFIAIWALGGSAWRGDLGAAVFLAIWLRRCRLRARERHPPPCRPRVGRACHAAPAATERLA
ncbi:MAG: hypothetical protein QM699_16520 [Amaricoccus sp.]|uniref:hypothetical protein n=1 Tax=Amaricoccus sp. TaxID=1872485 RepID=UPI0039E32EF4